MIFLKGHITWEDIWDEVSLVVPGNDFLSIYNTDDKVDNNIKMYLKLKQLDPGELQKIDVHAEVHEFVRKIVKDKTVEEFMIAMIKKIKAIQKNINKKRNERKWQSESIVYKATPEIKKALIADGLFVGKENILHLDYTKKRKNYSIVSTESEAIDLIMKYDLINFLGLHVKPDERFDCIFIKGLTAWISVNEKGYWKYFTKDKNDNAIAFGLIDLVEMSLEKKCYNVLGKIKETLKIKSKEGEWLQMQTEKYLENIDMIKKAGNQIQPKYPELYKYMGKYWFLLQELNVIGKTWSMNCNQVEGEAVFFAPVKYIEKFYSECNPRTISRAINMLVTVGLIEKIPTNAIPRKMLEIFYNKAEMHEYYKNEINCYTIPEMTPKVLKVAESRVKKLVKNNITIRSINFKSLKSTFGEELARSVFPNHIVKLENESNE